MISNRIDRWGGEEEKAKREEVEGRKEEREEGGKKVRDSHHVNHQTAHRHQPRTHVRVGSTDDEMI